MKAQLNQLQIEIFLNNLRIYLHIYLYI